MTRLFCRILALSALLIPLSASVQFDGSNGLINVGSASSLDNLGPATFSFWMRARGLGVSGFGRILDKGGSFHGIQIGPPGRVAFVKDYSTTDLRRESNDNSVVFDLWQHWAITYDGGMNAAGIKMFIDGVEQTVYQAASNAAGSYSSDAANDLIIGNRAAADRTFDGDLTELAIWSIVLGNMEIEQLAQRRPRTPLQIRRSSLVAYWPLSEFPYGQAVAGSVLDTSGNGHHGTASNGLMGYGWFLSRGAPATPPPPPDPNPWERDFTPLRTHYASPSGSGDGLAYGTPESYATARGHAQAGDLHWLLAGQYNGNFTFAADGTQANPIVWRAWVDANGDPERARISGGMELDGDWTWLWGLNCDDVAGNLASDACIQLQARGTAIINVIAQRIDAFHCATAFNFGPDMVIYGYTAIDCGWNHTAITGPQHNIYFQNSPANGRKYFVQMTSLDTAANPPNGTTRGLMHFGANGASQTTFSRLSNVRMIDSTMQRGTLFFPSTYTPDATGAWPQDQNIINSMWGIDLKGTVEGLYIGNQGQASMTITDSLFYKSKISYRVWGAGDGCHSYTQPSTFQNNEIYNPWNNADYFSIETRIRNGSCAKITGTPKLRDVDVWDNNTYGRTSGTGTFVLTANGSGPTAHNLAAFRTASDAARETGGGTAFDASSTEGAIPTTDRVECFHNFYQPNWGKCRAIDFDGNGSISLPGAEVDKIVSNGKTYKVRNERNFWGTPLASGTYTAGAGISSISVPGDAVSGLLLVWITSQP